MDWEWSTPKEIEMLQFSGTTGRSARNNNPLNLEYRPGSYQEKYGATLEPTGGGKDKNPRFAAFPDMMSGYLAGLEQIRLDQGKGLTLSQFVNKFAPSFENPTDQLISQYARAVGARRDTPLAEIPAEKLIVPMLARESSTRIVGKGKDEGLLGKIGGWLGPASAEAAEPSWGKPSSGGEQITWEKPTTWEKPAEFPETRSTGQNLAGAVANYLGLKLPIVGMTPAQIGALALGGTVGAGAGPGGAVAGAGLLYGAEEQAMKGLRQYAGQEPTETLPESAYGAAKDVATGATYEAAGQVGGVLAQPITEKVGQFVMNRARGLYERVLKAPPTVPAELRDKAVQTALEGDYAVTKRGLNKLQADMDIYRQKVSEVVDQAAAGGDKIDVKKVADGLDKLKEYFGDMPFPEKFITAINEAKGELVRIHGKEMPVDAAQRMKQRIYQVFEKYYKSRMGVDPIDVEINQAIASGIMKEIENKVPEVARMNKEWSNKINLAKLLERAVNRTRNYETLRMSDMIMATGGAAADRSVEGGFYSFLVNRVLNNPSVLSHLALKLGKNRPFVREMLTRGTAYGLTTQAKEDIEAVQPPEKIEPESKRGFSILNQ